MVLEWCISIADVAALLFLSRYAAKAEEKEAEQKTSNIDYITGRKLPYIKLGEDYVDAETGTVITDMYEDYEED